MKTLASAALLTSLLSGAAYAQTNAGEQPADPSLPFTVTQVASFDLPWRIAFLPDGRLLVTEKVGRLDLVTVEGVKTEVEDVPLAYYQGQNGLLGVFLSPHYATDHSIYLTYAEPGGSGGGLAMGKGRLVLAGHHPRLEGFKVLWRQLPKGKGGQEGAQIAFSPDGKYLFLSVGDRQRMTPAQDPNQPEGKILRLTLDGKPAPGNPMAGQKGAPHHSVDRSADGYRGGQDGAGGQHLQVPRPEPDSCGDLDERPSHALRARFRSRRQALGG